MPLSDLSSFMHDDDFAELLWENGQVVMQSQSNRPRKAFLPTPFPKESRQAGSTKTGLIASMDSASVNDLSISVPVPSANVGLHAQDDDAMAPWINYPTEDTFCSEFFSELAGVNPNSLPSDRNVGFGTKDFHNVQHGHSSTGFKEGQESIVTPRQCPTLIPSCKSRAADFSAAGGVGVGSSINPEGQIQKPLQLSGGMTNFSHFSRPIALTRPNVDHGNRSKSTKEASTLIHSTVVQGNSAADLAKREVKSAAKPHCISVATSEAFVQGGTSRNNNHYNGTANNKSAPEVNLQRHEAEKGGPEAVVASSVCSGSSAGAASNEPKNRQKRKNREGEESGYQSEDLEDDSMDVKKPTSAARAGTSTKRSRAAEVHNLSERRRRDRINEKMRALQELIPNCNKVDKASMLDEAIEYLKTLQLQVQMMSMGSGLCMSPVMLSPGMRGPAMAHFSPMGLGMGMGMGVGYGMGMLDMNGSPGCPLIPVPPMHASQFPCTSIAGATGLFGMPGHGQGLHMSMPPAQLFSPFPGLAAKANTMNEVSGTMVNPIPVQDATPSSRCKDQQNMNSESTQKASTNDRFRSSLPQINTGHTPRTKILNSVEAPITIIFVGIFGYAA